MPSVFLRRLRGGEVVVRTGPGWPGRVPCGAPLRGPTGVSPVTEADLVDAQDGVVEVRARGPRRTAVVRDQHLAVVTTREADLQRVAVVGDVQGVEVRGADVLQRDVARGQLSDGAFLADRDGGAL